MNKQIPILSKLHDLDKYNEIVSTLTTGNGAVSVFGLTQRAHMLAALYSDVSSSMLLVVPNENDCLKAEEELSSYGISAMYFPSATRLLSTSALAVSGGTEAKRTEQLVELLHGEKNFVIVSAECLMQKLAPCDALRTAVIELNSGAEHDMQNLICSLAESGYERTEICVESCTFTVRGGRVDVFPVNSKYPIRVEFFGDEIDSMRSFDPEEQRSIDNIDSFTIYPATETPIKADQKTALIAKLRRNRSLKVQADEIESGTSAYKTNQMLSLLYETTSYIFDYMSSDTVVVLNEPLRIAESAENEFRLFSDNVRTIIENEGPAPYLWDLMSEPSSAIRALAQEKMLMLSSFTTPFAYVSPRAIFQIDAPAMTAYMENEELLLHELHSYLDNDYATVIYAGRSAQNLCKMLTEHGIKNTLLTTLTDESLIKHGDVLILPESMPNGFEYREIKFAVITENELLGLSMHRKQAYGKQKTHRKSSDKLELAKLSVGDYVVHEVHGIGRFMGVREEEINGKKRDYMIIHYAGSDVLSIPCDQLDRVQKYIGGSETPPKLSKFASKDWSNTIARVKQSVKKIAFDLVALYGERMSKTGYAYSHDTPEQKLLEESFPYDETPDQLTAIADIKCDMESATIMDRLLCGDVGFGKTEVALRAAFKAVMDCKQAAFLVPTTILAYQHYNTLSSRYAQFGVRVDYISRFKNQQETETTLRKLKNGDIDVIVGTHRLLSKDIKFHDLGLLVIDEEQRFGVGHKESIKEMKKTVDVLTMTATPIPRTMHMSLIGIRDISLLDTPPKQRYPVQTFVTEYNETLVRDAILKELARGGQTFVLYNNVKDMDRYYGELCKLVPEASINFAHGQMHENDLEHVMLDFIDGKFDVLLSSTIIENGLDVPNANTMVVLESDKLGLAQMYQLRGRVGRSKRIGFTYFTFPQNKVLNEVSSKRLASIAQFTQLGSGYKIAMRDLQIRGAGDIMGAQQHGHMEEIGYEMYRKLISEAVDEARGYARPKKVAEARVEAPLDAYIPKTYISNEELRLEMYKRVAQVNGVSDYMDVQDELTDRFGDMPRPVENLMNVALLKAIAAECYITTLRVLGNEVMIKFASNAPYNIERIMDFASNMKAKLSNEGGMSMSLPEKNADKSKVCASLPRTLQKLQSCLDM